MNFQGIILTTEHTSQCASLFLSEFILVTLKYISKTYLTYPIVKILSWIDFVLRRQQVLNLQLYEPCLSFTINILYVTIIFNSYNSVIRLTQKVCNCI